MNPALELFLIYSISSVISAAATILVLWLVGAFK